jgi:hypothetical protein
MPAINLDSPQLREIVAAAASRTGLWSAFLRAANIKTMLEVGVWKGDFTKAMLEQCAFIEKYYLIDPWANLPDWNKPLNVKTEIFDAAYAEAMAKTEFAAAKRIVLRGRTKEVIHNIPDASLDFAYIDGDHTLHGITVDLIQVLPKIREGGFIGGDDFSKNPWQHSARFEPTLVFPFAVYFAEAMNLPIAALPHSQFLIHKQIDSKFSFTDFTGDYGDLSLNKLAASFSPIALAARALAKLRPSQ